MEIFKGDVKVFLSKLGTNWTDTNSKWSHSYQTFKRFVIFVYVKKKNQIKILNSMNKTKKIVLARQKNEWQWIYRIIFTKK